MVGFVFFENTEMELNLVSFNTLDKMRKLYIQYQEFSIICESHKSKDMLEGTNGT